MTDLLKQRIAENQTHPYMAQHELVFEIIELEKKFIGLQKGLEALLSSEKSGGNDNTSVIDGMSKEINYLKDELNKAWDRIVALEGKSIVAPVEAPVEEPVEATDSTEKK